MPGIFFLLLSFAITSSIAAQPGDNPMKSVLDSAVHKLAGGYMKDGTRVGVSIGVHYNGKSFTYNYGETSPGSGVLPTDRSVYEIGSITKTFTGLLVAHAITEGKINFTDDVRKFLPGSFPNLQYPNGEPVKIGYLLAHTAQFPNSFGEVLSLPVSNEMFLDSLRQIKLDTLRFKYAYSNVGYQLLGLILERVYQQSYSELISKYITSPLRMQQTKLQYNAAESKFLLKGHDAAKKPVNGMPATIPGAGSLYSSVKDLLNYLVYQNAEETPELKLTHRIIVGDVDNGAHGFQWSIGKTWNWDQYLRIDGGTKGFRTFCVMYPLQQISIVILTNQKDDSAGMELYKMVSGIYGVVKKLAAR